ncbi:MAG TPA: MFS transporter [Pirellulaceae bacterium]|nr:MFS transporter [Pirellulaceae bacterium]
MGDLGWNPPADDSDQDRGVPWFKLLNRYHWFVLIVAALGWLFDTMDQQLFNFARVPAMKELLAPGPGQVAPQDSVDFYGGVATAVFMIGWATGGLVFGVLGDRIGRARTMLLTILLYSLCTGFSAISFGVWDFMFYRFITGLGVGGEFAVGVALVAEVMPSRARQHALSLLQALSAVGNIAAATISVWLGHLETIGVIGNFDIGPFRVSNWRLMFVIGTLPALLAILIRGRLKEPERWTRSVGSDEAPGTKPMAAGSYRELFGDPRWRHGAIIGLALATSGVIGVWGIAFFSFDLVRSVFRKQADQEVRETGLIQADIGLIALALADPTLLDQEMEGKKLAERVAPTQLIGTEPGSRDTDLLWSAIVAHHADKGSEVATDEGLVAALPERSAAALEKHREAFDRLLAQARSFDPESLAARIAVWEKGFAAGGKPVESLDGKPLGVRLATYLGWRNGDISGELTKWSGYAGILLNLGAFFGMYSFGAVASRIGRRPAFLLAFAIAAGSAILLFSMLQTRTDALWMFPLMGFCVLSPFAGYAIYFPELFPTRLRSTGTSFCYNVGRYLAATGPLTLGYLTGTVFADKPEPLRWAGVAMCGVYLIGVLALPFAKETKDHPLPD